MLQETPKLDGQVPVATPSRALAAFWAKYKKRPHINESLTSSPSEGLDPPAPATATTPAVDPPAPTAPPVQVEPVGTASPVDVEAVSPAVEGAHTIDSTMACPPASVDTKDDKNNVYIRPLFDARLANEFNRLCKPEFHDPVHTRVTKMDDDEISTKMVTFMNHPSLRAFESYMQSQCLSHLGTYRFGNDEPVAEITAFELWLQAEQNCLPAPPAPRGPLTPPPAPSPISAVKAVLTRANTVDLGGQRAAVEHVETPRDSPPDPAPAVVISLANKERFILLFSRH